MITSYDYISREWEIVYYNQDNMVPRFLCCFLLLLQIYWMYLYIFLHDVEKLLYNNIMVNIEITIRNVCFVCVYLQIFKAFLILKSRQKNWFAVDFWNEWKKCVLHQLFRSKLRCRKQLLNLYNTINNDT